MRVESGARAGEIRGLLWALLAAVLPTSCRTQDDPDALTRREWLHEQTVAHNVYLREFLNGTEQMQFYDGWYDIENDAETGGAWRWQSKRSITRLRTRPDGMADVTDMRLTVYGWVPTEDVGFRSMQLEFAVNGHVLDRFDPPQKSFEHSFVVPKNLLEHSEWVDFVITVANTTHPRGDWRELGFATTGFIWKPVDPS